jgi:protein required for attachment to host cells
MTTTRKTTWVVIADGMRARILKWEGADRFTPAIKDELYDASVHGFARDLKSDAPGRAFDTGSGARHAMQPRHDPHEMAKERFDRHVAAVVNDAAARKAFDRLVLAAPPKALGVLRDALGEPARKCVVGEVHKDLIRTPLDQLADHLRGVLGA